MRRTLALLALPLLVGCSSGEPGVSSSALAADGPDARPEVFDLWSEGQPAFGVFVPNENPRRPGQPAPEGPSYTAAGAERIVSNPLYDFLFLNLEGSYDSDAVRTLVAGMRSDASVGRKALLVRIPSIDDAGEDVTRARIAEVFALGADGITLPHVRSVEEARLALSMFRETGLNFWSPQNQGGDKIAMMMVEDPDAVAAAGEIADLGGFTVLATGIGSLRAALGGDAEGAEAGTQQVLVETRRAGLVNMLTANVNDVEQRVQEGFLALLMSGPTADEAIQKGRAAAGRE